MAYERERHLWETYDRTVAVTLRDYNGKHRRLILEALRRKERVFLRKKQKPI